MNYREPNGSGGTVTPERWQQVKAVLDGALECRTAERSDFLKAACNGDSELRQEVESLLASESVIGDFIEEPIFDLHLQGQEEPALGHRIDAYRVVREVGRGGMGSVFLAARAESDFEGQFALKIIRRGMDSDEVVQRFRAERRILTRLEHPNIARILDGGTTDDGRPYFVMEHVEGRPIDEYCDAEGLSVPARLELFLDVCSAVQFAHQNLIVHRDLKPANILVTRAGTPKLLDFGIAKILDPDKTEPALSILGRRPMTPQYASPEQLLGKQVTTASDVYALGVLLYILLTGRSPYGTPPPEGQDLTRAVCEEDPSPPSEVVVHAPAEKGPQGDPRLLRRRLAGDLDTIVLKAMHKEPQRRYASAEQLAADIRRHLDGLPVLARRDTPAYLIGKFVRRHQWGVGFSAVAMLSIIIFSITVTQLWRRAVQERDRAETISHFLLDLFAIPDPSQSRGEQITAREVLDRGTEKISKDLQNQPEVRATLMDTMGQVYRSLGLYKPARRLSEESLAIRRRILGNDDLLVAASLQNLAILRREMGDDAAAEPLLKEALEIQRRRGSTDTPEYAKALNDFAALAEEKGDLDSAESLYRESLTLKRKLFGNDHEDVARGLNNLGRLRHAKKDYKGAERFYEEALAIRRRRLGAVHPEVATTLNNLAVLYEDEGDLLKAERTYRDVLDMRRRLLGPRHPRVARSLSNLATLLQRRKDFREAEPLFREAWSIADESLGPKHPERAVYMRNLASVLLDQGRVAEAEPLAREALEIQRQAIPTSWRVADAEGVLGGCLAAQGRFKEAEALLVGAYEALSKDQGDGGRHVDEARSRIAALYEAWGKSDRAAAYAAQGSASPRH
jgi:serine/threonine-protein kinase